MERAFHNRQLTGSPPSPFHKLIGLLLLSALSCVMASCVPQKRVPAPVYRAEPQGKIRSPEHRPQPQGQTTALLASANQALREGQPDKAEMHLERALRLTPGDARLWQAMARVRFEQGRYSQAVQFCLKSNSLAAGKGEVIRQNWLLMKEAYLRTGDREKAAEAGRKAGIE